MIVSSKPLQILILYDRLVSVASTVFEHLEAFGRYSRHNYFYGQMLGEFASTIDLDRFDVIVIHYTLVASSEFYLSAAARSKIAQSRALKVMFIQDEYRFVNRSIAAMRQIGLNLLFTCVPEGEIEKVYPAVSLPGVMKINVLTGYVPERLLSLPVVPFSKRPIDIGYRSRKVPAWLGELGLEKSEIGYRVLREAASTGLNVDISLREEDRIYGKRWVRFVRSCKAMLGSESGASVFDFTGDIQQKVEAHEVSDPSVSFRTLHDLYFADVEGKIDLAQLSPRCFEAAALGTLMILYEGRYSGVLEPWCHYVPLKKDHSNFSDIVALLKDERRATGIVERARTEIALNPRYSYRQSVEDVDQGIERALRPSMMAVRPPYTTAEFRAVSKPELAIRWRRMKRDIFDGTNRLVFGQFLSGLSAERRDSIKARIRRVYRAVKGRRLG